MGFFANSTFIPVKDRKPLSKADAPNAKTPEMFMCEIGRKHPYHNILLIDKYYCPDIKCDWRITSCGCEISRTGSRILDTLGRYGKIYCKTCEPLKGGKHPRKSKYCYEGDIIIALRDKEEEEAFERALNDPNSHLYR